jgi:TatD DNase family protein
METNMRAVELADQHEQIYVAVGIHPNDGLTWMEDTINQLRDMAQHPKVVAIGEIGLDYYRNRCPQEIQKSIFNDQLLLAAETNLPVIIHNRNAFQDLWPILTAWREHILTINSSLWLRTGVLHSYDGNLPDAREIEQANFRIGINGPVTFKNAQDRHQVAAGIAENSLILETDAPFLTPHPHRGKRNEPSFVLHINSKIAALRGISAEQLAQITSQNADKLFLWRAA